MTLLRRLTVLSQSALLAGAALVVLSPTPAAALPTDAELALRWAPVHYQDTDSSDHDADYLSTVDYDGEWDTLNNWERRGLSAASGNG